MSLRWERRTETPSGAVCARAEKTPQGLKSDAPGADASPGPTSKECSRTKETSSAPRLPSPLAVATPVPAPAGVSGSVARAPVALRDDAGGSKSSSAAAAKPAVASSARRSSVRVMVLLRGTGVRSGVSEDRSKCSEGGGEIGGAGWEDRCARWHVGAIGIDAWGGHRVRCAPHDACYSCSGHSEWVRAGAFAQTFISLGSVQNHFVRAGPLRRSEARCRPRRVSSLRRLRTASALAGSRR